MKKSTKKNLINAGVVLAIFSLTIYYVFHGEDLGQLLQSIESCDWRWIVPSVMLVIFFIWGESAIIWYMLREFGIRRKKTDCFLVSTVGFFFSAITPSASGGQPMQMYFMKKMDIPLSVSSIILMVVTITYKLVLVLVQIWIFVFHQNLVHEYLGSVIYLVYLGMFLNIVGIAGLMAFVFWPRLVRVLTGWTVRLLQKLHIVKAASLLPQKAEAALIKYHEFSAYLKKNLHLLLKIQLLTFLQRFALFFVTCLVYRALQLKGTGWNTILMLQSTISLTVDMLPMPGGMGISEYLFQQIFEPVFGASLLTGLVLSRGISYYVQLLVSAVGTGIAAIHLGKEQEKAPEDKAKNGSSEKTVSKPGDRLGKESVKNS